VAVGVYDVEEADNVGVVHLFEERDLADGSRGDALILGFETNLLEGDNALVLGGEVAGLVDNTICSLAMSARAPYTSEEAELLQRRLRTLSDLFQLLVVLHGSVLRAVRASDDRRSGVF
jgi:hypothetical protein